MKTLIFIAQNGAGPIIHMKRMYERYETLSVRHFFDTSRREDEFQNTLFSLGCTGVWDEL